MPAIVSSSPVIHSVHFYDQDEALIERLRSIVTSAIDVGNSVLIVASAQHREHLTEVLESRMGDLGELKRQERLNLYDAEETLAKFMVNGSPEPKRFLSSVGELVRKTKQAAWNQQRGLTAFGEMVAILWSQGNQTGALELEALWNDLLNDRAFHLHCAYPRSLFNSDVAGIQAICAGHSHVVGYAA